jgi:F0F1-type ATP synthase assembly protein I
MKLGSIFGSIVGPVIKLPITIVISAREFIGGVIVGVMFGDIVDE